MNELDPTVSAWFHTAVRTLDAFLTSLAEPYRLWQIALILAIWGAAYLGRMLAAPRLYAWMRGREGWPKWRLRALVLIHKRLRSIIFVVLAWAVVGLFRELAWPQRSAIVFVAATLATAWLVVGLLARIIRNRFLRRIVTWGAWIYVTLLVLGVLPDAERGLDSLAVPLGTYTISVLDVLKALVITGVLFTLARLASSNAARTLSSNEDISPSMRVLVIKVMQVVLYGSAFFIGLKAVGFDLTGLAVLSGAIGVGLGFGLQKVVSNLVSGVIILLDKSVKPGDVISLGETFGWINALGARYVSVVTRDGKEYLIPNEDLITGQVVNWSHSNDFVRLDLFFGTSYGDDPHKVRALAVEAAQAARRVLRTRPAVCHIVGFGDSSVDYILRFWIRDPTEGLTNVRGAVYLALWDTFKANGISIPFPQREVRVLDRAGSTLTDRETAVHPDHGSAMTEGEAAE